MTQWIEDPQGRLEVEKVTKEMKLPVWKANHKGKFRDFWNELWDKIEDYVVKLKGDTEKKSKGLNDRLVSAVGKHDGDFPIENAVVGNVYYSELTKKYYKCKIGGPAPMPNGNFIDMSILENLNRLENLNSFDILYSKVDDFGNWKDLTINLIKPADDSKYSHYIIYTGQGNQITNSILVTSTTHLDLYFDCYQYSNPGRVGVAFATFVNSTTVKLKILEGQASGDGIVKILAFKKA